MLVRVVFFMYEGRRNFITFILALIVDMNARHIVYPILELFIESEPMLISICGSIDAMLGLSVILLAIKLKYIKTIKIDFDSIKYRILYKSLIYCGVATILSNILSFVMCNFFDSQVILQSNVDSNNYLLSMPEKIFHLIYVCLVVPLNEEMFFRGVLIRVFKKSLGVPVAVLISALTFGLLHGVSFSVIINATFMGIAFGYVYTKTNNLAYTMFLHSALNFVVTLKSFGV